MGVAYLVGHLVEFLPYLVYLVLQSVIGESLWPFGSLSMDCEDWSVEW